MRPPDVLCAECDLVKAADKMAAAFDVIKCNLDRADSGCQVTCDQCSLMKAHKARNAYLRLREKE